MIVLETAGKEMLIIVKEGSIRDERQIVSLSGRLCWERSAKGYSAMRKTPFYWFSTPSCTIFNSRSRQPCPANIFSLTSL
jgi:hypothetical protein